MSTDKPRGSFVIRTVNCLTLRPSVTQYFDDVIIAFCIIRCLTQADRNITNKLLITGILFTILLNDPRKYQETVKGGKTLMGEKYIFIMWLQY